MKTTALKLLGIAFSLAAATAFADVTYYVSPGGDGTDPTSGDLTKAYAHPQTAIDAADGTTPTTVIIDDGTYTVPSGKNAVVDISVGNVTLETRNGYGTVTFDGGTTKGSVIERALRVAPGLENVAVKDIILYRGSSYRDVSNRDGSNVNLQSGTFENCDFIGYTLQRAAMMVLGGTATFRNCRIKSMDSIAVDSNGDYTAVTLSGSAVFEDCVFGPFTWYANGGNRMRALSMSGSVALRRCTVQGMVSGRPHSTNGQGYGTEKGGGLTVTGGTITDCIFTNNLVYGYGGGLHVNGANVTVSGCLFRDNTATGRYNDIYVEKGTVTETAAEDLDGTNGNLGAYPDKVQDGAKYAIVVSNAVKAVRAGVMVPLRLDATSGVAPTDYAWTFEDATEDSGRSVTHAFAAAGAHTVTCVVTRDGGSTVTVAKDVLVVGDTCYVSKTGSNTPPYDTIEKAARHPQDALDLRPAKVVIDTGKYALRNGARDTSILSFAYGYDGIEVTAKNGRGTVWLDGGLVNPGNGGLSRVVTVGDGVEGVVFSDLCLTNGWSCYNAGNSRGTLYAYGGTFRNCSINLSGFSRNGGGLITKTAVLTNCLITSIKPFTSTGSTADIGITVSDGAQMIDCEICDYKWCTGWTYDIPCVALSGATSLIRGCLFHGIEIGKTGSGVRGAAIYATGGTIENCTITDCKSLNKGGGLYINGAGVVCRNNIIINNAAVNGGNDIATATDYSMVTHTLASDLTTSKDTGNLQSASVLFKPGTYELDKDSQCVNAGENQNWMDEAHDRAGNPRIYDGTVDMGAYECQEKSVSLTADFSVSSATSFGPPPLDVQVTANVSGGDEGATYAWDWGDGTFLEMNATNGVVTHTYTNVGAYTVQMTVSRDGLTCVYALTNVVAAVGDVCYVSTNGAAIPPYDTWAKATSNIQDAFAYKPKTVLVSNGTYRVTYDDDDYGIKLYDAVRLVSVNGASNTVIRSNYANPGTGESSRMRNLVRMTHAGASVEGFTLCQTCPPMIYATAGRFENNLVTGTYKTSDSCNITTFAGPVGITNCVFDGSTMAMSWANYAGALVGLSGGAAMDRCVVRNATFKIGTANNTVRSAVSLSGGKTVMRNTFVTDMAVSMRAEARQNWGVYVPDSSTVENCTIIGSRIAAGNGAGLCVSKDAKIRNVISYDNRLTTATSDEDRDLSGSSDVFENNLIGVGELPETAKGCIVGEDPCFADDVSGYRITSASPCYNAGARVDWAAKRGQATDIDGQERHCGPIDISCWELQRPMGLTLLIR